MTAKYYGKKLIKNEFGDILRKMTPCVEITMKENEVDRFHKMLDYITKNIGWSYDADLIADGIGGTVSAYVPVDDAEDGRDFFECYKEAKANVK